MAFLQCPECRLTVRAIAYYLRGDECPRCRTAMEPRERFRSDPTTATPGAADAAALGFQRPGGRPAASG